MGEDTHDPAGIDVRDLDDRATHHMFMILRKEVHDSALIPASPFVHALPRLGHDGVNVFRGRVNLALLISQEGDARHGGFSKESVRVIASSTFLTDILPEGFPLGRGKLADGIGMLSLKLVNGASQLKQKLVPVGLVKDQLEALSEPLLVSFASSFPRTFRALGPRAGNGLAVFGEASGQVGEPVGLLVNPIGINLFSSEPRTFDLGYPLFMP